MKRASGGRSNKWWLLLGLVPAALAPAVFGGCDVTIKCEDGACASSSVAGTGGSTTCIEIPAATSDTHGFPPDVFAVLKENCYSCHGDPLQNGAPHTFLFYEDTQAFYSTVTMERWWSAMRKHAVTNLPPSMPYLLPPIPNCQKKILDDWANTCGSPDTADMCAKGMSGSTSSSSSSSGSTSSGSTSSSDASSSSGSGSSSSTGP